MSKPITISIVDDSSDLRENIGGYLGAFPEFRCISSFATAQAALEGLPKNPPDVVLMDINLGEHAPDGIECVRSLKTLLPNILVVMLTVFEDSEKIFRALAAGASGYLLKRQRPEELLAAIREVVAGGAPMSTSIARKVVRSFQSPPPRGTESAELSPANWRCCRPWPRAWATNKSPTSSMSAFTPCAIISAAFTRNSTFAPGPRRWSNTSKHETHPSTVAFPGSRRGPSPSSRRAGGRAAGVATRQGAAHDALGFRSQSH